MIEVEHDVLSNHNVDSTRFLDGTWLTVVTNEDKECVGVAIRWPKEERWTVISKGTTLKSISSRAVRDVFVRDLVTQCMEHYY